MENYENEPSEINHIVDIDPFEKYQGENITRIQVNTKRWKITLNHALKKFNFNKPIILSADGSGISKAVSCVEIIKTKVRTTIYQNTQICQMKTVEVWMPLLEGLDPLRVTRTVPIIHILLSYEPLDDTVPGFQKYIHRRIKKHIISESDISCPPSP